MNDLKKRTLVVVAIVALAAVAALPAFAWASSGTTAKSTTHRHAKHNVHYTDDYTLVANFSFLKGERKNADGTYNVAVEIPAGTSAKWETSTTATNVMYWEFKNGAPRVVKYLPYVGNYGSLVNSKAADGDPLDVLILGPSVARGSIQKVKIIGVAKVLDGGDQDDKVIAVRAEDPMGAANSLADLDVKYVGVTDIVKTWFVNYKGPGEMAWERWGEAAEAKALADSTPAFK